MSAPEGNSEFCSPLTLNVSSTSSRETLRLSGKHQTPREQTLSVTILLFN